jgi:glycerol-3-phosphate cytidylyltransferase
VALPMPDQRRADQAIRLGSRGEGVGEYLYSGMSRSYRVYAYGGFDLFHTGHVRFIREARELGGYLTVGVLTDEAFEQTFHYPPVIPFRERIEIVRALFDVNEAIAQETPTPDINLRDTKANLLAGGTIAGWNYDQEQYPGSETMEILGGTVVFMDHRDEQSTDAIIAKIKSL